MRPGQGLLPQSVETGAVKDGVAQGEAATPGWTPVVVAGHEGATVMGKSFGASPEFVTKTCAIVWRAGRSHPRRQEKDQDSQ